LRKANELIERFLDSIGQEDGAVYVQLFQAWREIAGERLADHANPIDIRGTSLVVETDHPGWSQMIIMQRKRILFQLNRRFPQLHLSGVTVHLHSDIAEKTASPGVTEATPETIPGETTPPPPPSRDEKESLERIEDPELKEMLKRLRGNLDDV
jgi:hypothetical protein